MTRTTRQQEVNSIRKGIKNYQQKIKQQHKTINTFLDYSLSSERYKNGIISQLTDASMHFMEIHEQTLDGIAQLNNFASQIKYTNKNLVNTITQIFDNTAFAIYNHDQILNSMSQLISSGGKDLSHDGNALVHNGRDLNHNGNASVHNGKDLSHDGNGSDHNGRDLSHDGNDSAHNGRDLSRGGNDSVHSGNDVVHINDNENNLLEKLIINN